MLEPPTLLILVRHGRTEWNAQRRFLGRTDLPLDDVGRAQAVERARDLPWTLDAVYSSTLRRASETAEAFGEPVVVEGLEELDQGELEGLEATEAIERWPAFFSAWVEDPTHLRPPGSSETLGIVQRRALAAVGRIAERHPGGTVAVVSHQLVLAALRCAAHEQPLATWRSHRLDNLETVPLVMRGGVLRPE